MKKDKLFTRSYLCILGANFMMFLGFWTLIPILPFYLKESYNCSESQVGLILCCYTITALSIRPFSGYLLDSFKRKPLYILAYTLFCLCFLGYTLINALILFVIIRALHGMAFGGVTVGGNTIVVDIMPPSRRGEGLGYYGLTNNTAMSIGPMAGLLLHDIMSYNEIFITALSVTIVGLTLASLVKCPEKAKVKRPPISLDRFILSKGIPASITLTLLSVPYGATTNYVALYSQELNIEINSGLFFTLMAVGMGVSRIFSGKYVDKGYVCNAISAGFVFVITAFALLSFCPYIKDANLTLCSISFFTVPVLLGIGFGSMFPAYNTLYINLAQKNQRATATSTYLTSWDVGIGIGMLTGGLIAEKFSFDKVYLFGTLLCIISMLYFNAYVRQHYERNKTF
ncbi:MAG: MFS transporter [Bacteroidaceae bacterium]|nr:MFS transporter [Bacteroidaceae bacterium]